MNKSSGERYDILLPFPPVHWQLLKLHPHCLERRWGGLVGGSAGSDLAGISPSPEDLHGLLLAASKPWSAEGFSDSVPSPTSPLHVKYGSGRRRKAAEILTWKMTWFRVSHQLERQISSNRTPRTLFLPLPHSQ